MTLLTCVSLPLYLLAGCAAPGPQPPDSVLVEYRRSGGIAGRTVTLVVQADGGATLTGGHGTQEFAVPADTLARLRQLLDSEAIDDLRNEYLPSQPGADLFQYDVTFDGRTIRTADGAVPAALQPLLELLGGLAYRRS